MDGCGPVRMSEEAASKRQHATAQVNLMQLAAMPATGAPPPDGPQQVTGAEPVGNSPGGAQPASGLEQPSTAAPTDRNTPPATAEQLSPAVPNVRHTPAATAEQTPETGAGVGAAPAPVRKGKANAVTLNCLHHRTHTGAFGKQCMLVIDVEVSWSCTCDRRAHNHECVLVLDMFLSRRQKVPINKHCCLCRSVVDPWLLCDCMFCRNSCMQ